MPGTPSQLRIEPDEIHLWLTNPEMITDATLLASYHPLLNEKEVLQQKRFLFEKHRHQYLVTRALVRFVLSRYCDTPPATWRFKKNRYGKPEINPGQSQHGLRFNLSHTDGRIVCAVTQDKDLGVDVEDEFRKCETTGIAHRFFSPEEVRDLKGLPEEEQRSRFFDYWTLKESYIKACGMGLAIPLEHFSFDLSLKSKIGISFVPKREDTPLNWQFWLFKPSHQHKIALAIHCDVREIKYKIVMRNTIPLQSEEIVNHPFIRGD